MSVASAQLAIVSATTSLATAYTVPANTRTILKSVVVNNNHGAANNVSVYIYSSGGSQVFIMTFYMAADGSDGDTKFSLPWIVVNAGETVRTEAQFSTVFVALSGAELAL